VQTIKAANVGSFVRGEWESELEGAKPDLGKTKHTPLSDIAHKKTARKLKPIFQTKVQRTTRPVQVGPSEIELAIDQGRLAAGRRAKAIREFELELKKGRTRDLFRIAKNFERKTGAELDLRSRAERGYQLVNGEQPDAVHAAPVELKGSMTTHDAFNVVALSTLRQFSANADGAREENGEAIHQMRVGVRRLRAAMSFFGDILPGAEVETIKTELKWLTNELGPAREIDVFIKDKITPLKKSAAPRRGARALKKEFSGRRKKALVAARRALKTQRYRLLLLDVLEWLETRRKRPRKEATMPIAAFAHDLLTRRVRKARKQGRDLEPLSPEERHKLRIKMKKIRYGVDFFRSLYPAKAKDELDQFLTQVKKIQDALGALNDFVAHEKLASQAALEAPPADRRARAFTSGLLVGQEREATRHLIKAAQKEIRRLRPIKRAPA
jgi:inorganic triphosphatase YgiF